MRIVAVLDLGYAGLVVIKAVSICLSFCLVNVAAANAVSAAGVLTAEGVSAFRDPAMWVTLSTVLVLYLGSSMSRRVQD